MLIDTPLSTASTPSTSSTPGSWSRRSATARWACPGRLGGPGVQGRLWHPPGRGHRAGARGHRDGRRRRRARPTTSIPVGGLLQQARCGSGCRSLAARRGRPRGALGAVAPGPRRCSLTRRPGLGLGARGVRLHAARWPALRCLRAAWSRPRAALRPLGIRGRADRRAPASPRMSSFAAATLVGVGELPDWGRYLEHPARVPLRGHRRPHLRLLTLVAGRRVGGVLLASAARSCSLIRRRRDLVAEQPRRSSRSRARPPTGSPSSATSSTARPTTSFPTSRCRRAARRALAEPAPQSLHPRSAWPAGTGVPPSGRAPSRPCSSPSPGPGGPRFSQSALAYAAPGGARSRRGSIGSGTRRSCPRGRRGGADCSRSSCPMST